MLFHHLDTPCLIVLPEHVEFNIAEMVRMAGDVKRLRPHIKTHKTAEGIQLMQAAGITKFKCATIAEGELLGMQKAHDVILAHQPGGPKLERLLSLIKTYPDTTYSTITDNIESAKDISNFFSAHGMSIGIYIDINVGMNRTGIRAEDTLDLYHVLKASSGLDFKGLHVYDGQHRQSDPIEKEKACDTAFQPVFTLCDEIVALGDQRPHIVAGGSPSFSIHANRTDRDCSPGTNIFWDHNYASICPEQHFKHALQILTRVISVPASNKICLDLGHKSVASENPIDKRVYFPTHPNLKPVSQSEEHLVMEVDGEHNFKVGDLLIGIPYHVCPTVALHEYLHEVKNEEVTGSWEVIARKRRINC
jgi:D-serine deaminase-like pyridoxal phosphate-dependent protein